MDDSSDTEWDMDPDENSEDNTKNELMNKLPLNNFYTILDKEADYDTSIQNMCTGYVDNKSPNIDTRREFCYKLVYKLKNFDGIKSQCSNIENEKYCDYINYWLGDQIKNHNYQTTDINLIENLFDVLSAGFIDTKCSSKRDKIGKDKFPKMKEFFDYTENLNGIDKLENTLNTLNGGYYCTYILNAVKSYNKIIEKELCMDTSCEYYEELENFKNKFIELQDSLGKKWASDMDKPCIQISKGTYHESCKTFKHTYGDFQRASTNNQHTGDSNSMIKIVTPMCVLSGLFFLSFILYKFTPFGSWVDQRISRKKKIWDNTEEEIYQLENPSFNDNEHSYKKRHNIVYHASVNY
ncbi:PIR Superfamily Protein [Plasmodium ovale wallikeri]|uniref:PIR Superfamily Protein n=1 Tax=Plasmodium ovale wallikeri TaxID=864142 RepID=A0A1A9A5M5_PLAOA|nr:PIR Superfamily Protein [Plasmodium ovale wallikeri]SBT54053.1 PIR Superfamily Protein [Plasmodium ovale wallikeri]